MDADAIQYQRARQQLRTYELGQQMQQFEAKMQAMRDQVSSFERHQAAQASWTNGLGAVVNSTNAPPATGVRCR